MAEQVAADAPLAQAAPEVAGPSREAILAERLRHADGAGRLRLYGASAALLLWTALYGASGEAALRIYLEPLGLYLALALALRFGRETRPLRDAAWLAALIDISLVFWAQLLALPLSRQPAAVAGYSLGFFAVALVFNAPSLSLPWLALAAAATAAAQGALMARAGVSSGGIAGAVLVVGLLAWAAHAAVRHMHALALGLLRAKTEHRRESARFLEETDARRKIERMLAQERELHGRYRTVVEEAAARQQKREEVERVRREILEGITRNAPLVETLARLVGMLERHHPEAACGLIWRDGEAVSFVASATLPEELRADPTLAAELTLAHLGAAAIAAGVIGVSRVPADPPWDTRRALCGRQGFETCWTRAIGAAGGRDLGGLVLLLRSPATPSADDRALLDLTAQLATLAVERAELAELLVHQADHDALTGLPNRRKLDHEVRVALAEARRRLQPIAVGYFDLDRFKGVNDTLGHAMGDGLLVQVAERLRSALAPGDSIARMGGDEFAVVFRGASAAIAVDRAKKLLDALSALFALEGHELYVCGCAGIAAYPDDGQDGSTLLRNADAALYAAKSRGPGSIECFNPRLADASRDTLELENDLRRALDRGELRLVFQEQIDRQGRIECIEALVRWEHPRLGLLSPVRFIPLAEEAGLIVRLGEWVLEASLATVVRLRESGHGSVRVAVNVSGLQLRQPDFVDRTLTACARAGVDPAALELELTESVLSDDADVVVKLAHLRAAGMAVAIDDFGTGYSSLGYLQRLPIDTVKIDRSFVMQLGTRRTPAALISAVASISHSLGLRVVAEGVETVAQLDELHALGCDLLQGYWFGKPAAADEIDARLRLADAGSRCA